MIRHLFDKKPHVNVEIERKFLVSGKPPGKAERYYKIRQGYIAREKGNVVRVRQQDDLYILSVKTPAKGLGRFEIEANINASEGEVLLAACTGGIVEKTREIYNFGDHAWEVDVFEGKNKGLIIAEVELSSEDEDVILPGWVGPEVTGFKKFYNANLSLSPFTKWGVKYPDLVDRMKG